MMMPSLYKTLVLGRMHRAGSIIQAHEAHSTKTV